MKGLGLRIRTIRKEKGMTQSEMGDFLSMSQQTIARYENDLGDPTVEALVKIADLGHRSLEWLLTGRTSCGVSEATADTPANIDTDLLESAIKLVEIIVSKYNLKVNHEKKAKSIKILYEWAVIEERNDVGDVSEEKVMKVLELAS